MTPLSEIRLLALDVDGVLTDGYLYYGARGVTQRFCAGDGAGLVELRRLGFPVALISFRDFPATRRRAADLGIEILCLGSPMKEEALRMICRHLSIECRQALFMGDGLMDLPAIRTAGVGACPADAHPAVRASCDIVTEQAGGCGAVREVVNLILGELPHG
ncbi:MAG: HAD hydrolase family protein [Candidatus Fermentibacteraceae bacterium]|nr:HAD hydrolase family protein [Candidatus Fermentibacteraceae bacterium]MBN2608000.1 HAD hydrolase family protein [Candidatus Fermentibacteraceae bacterium]